MIDVFKIKVGDLVKTRGGKWLSVKAVSHLTNPSYEVALSLGELGNTPYTKDGRYWKDGESTYDIVEHVSNQAEEEPAQDEMTMRDQFAMSALNGLLIGSSNWRGTSPEELAEVSYSLADTMMKARKEKG